MTRAYILIETQVGKTRDVVLALRSLSGVPSADIITGDFDIIALVEASDMKQPQLRSSSALPVC